MPIIDYRYRAGLFSAEEKDHLAAELTECLLRCDVTRDNPKARGINWCYLNEVSPGDIYVGGQREMRPHHRVDVFVMKGAMSMEVKQQVVQDMTAAILHAEKHPINPLNAARIWVLIHEIEDGDWGAAGGIYRLQDLMGWLGS